MGKRKRRGWSREGGLVFAVVGLLAVLGGGIYLAVSYLDRDEPSLKLLPETACLGAKTNFVLSAVDQGSGLREVEVIFGQNAQEKVIVSQAFPPGGDKGVVVELPFVLEPRALGFQEGKARLVAWARDRSWRHWFQGQRSQLSREVDLDFVPMTLSFVAVSHLLHAGGTGCITYRLNKVPKESGLQVGECFYTGYANPKGPQGEYMVLFALPQEISGPVVVELKARPAVGEEVRQAVSLKVRPRRWRQDTMNLSENFLRQVAAGFPVSQPGDLLAAYLEVNRNIRQANHDKIRQVCRQSHPQPLWSGGFLRYEGKPMARFGDRRTYVWQGRVVDQQIHLGEDLANLIATPVPAANKGIVVLAEPLGIYGQTVILDHGLGVFSMYSHLSQMDVKVGEMVDKGKLLGKTGATGLAGGDHLHFSMIIGGDFVDPLEWWDPHWLKDQVEGVWVKGGVAMAAAGTVIQGEEDKKPAGKRKGHRPGTKTKRQEVGKGR